MSVAVNNSDQGFWCGAIYGWTTPAKCVARHRKAMVAKEWSRCKECARAAQWEKHGVARSTAKPYRPGNPYAYDPLVNATTETPGEAVDVRTL